MNALHLLAADIGGTNSRFALFRLECIPPSTDAPDTPDAPISVKVGHIRLNLVPGSKLTLSTPEQPSFSQLLKKLRELRHFDGLSLLDESFGLIGASLAVPGPVRDGVCHAPNISWPLDAREACAALEVKSLLLNDFAAQGLACLFPAVQGLRPLLSGQPESAAPKIILGAGTGLGKAIILPPGKNAAQVDTYGFDARILPSEGGHSLFPFRGPEEAAFEAFLRKVSGRREVIGDMVVTGYGLSALYAFHGGENKLLPPPEVTPKLAGRPAALEWLARFYGRACRNMLLETLALGGVLLSGGLISHVPGLLGHPAFEAEFRNSETQAALLARAPVCWVSNQESGLWGAALHFVTSAFFANT